MNMSPIPVAEGRFFTRKTADATAIVGAVKVPAGLILEVQVPLVIGPTAMLLLDQSLDPFKDHVYPEMLLENAADGVLLSLKYRSFMMPGVADVLLRETHLACGEPGMKWALVIGAAKHDLQLPGPRGLYEIKGNALTYCKVAEELYNGSSINDVLRACHWGDGGLWGMATSMDPATYDKWIAGERERNAKRDPKFKQFIDAMAKEGLATVPTVYRQEDVAVREEASKRVMRKLIEREFSDEAGEPQGCAPLATSKPVMGSRARP